jgi:hypothetical protein
MSPYDPPGSEWQMGARAWPAPAPRGPGPGWSTAGIVLAVVIAILGLAVLAGAVLYVVAVSNLGSNK